MSLNDIGITFWKADNRGYFVAKFLAGDVKGTVDARTTATLTLEGTRKDGVEFFGTDEVKMIEVKSKK